MKVKLNMSSPAHIVVFHLRVLDFLLLRLFMAAFRFTRLYSVFKWFRRSAFSFWRCAKRVLYPIGPYVFPLRWRERSGDDPGELERSGGGPGELERNGGDPGELERIGDDPGELEHSGGDAGELERNSDPGELERKSGDLVELERNGGDPQKVEDSRPEGQHEAAGADAPAGKRAADSDRELAPKRPKFEEEEGEFGGEEYRVDPSEDWCCGYDSTWEAEEPPRGARPRTRRPAARYSKFGRFESASRDMQNYRHGYPNSPQSQIRRQRFNQVSDDKPNLQFYLGNKCSEPDGVHINSFHQDWYGDYYALESVHSYIQWLFPLQEPGMNSEACILTKEEIKEFCANDTAKANLLTSYRLMLDFYGIELCDENNGEVKRASNWKERFKNLNCRTHNNLRITRILKCLGTLGYPHYQAPLVRFFLEETLVHGELPAVKDSVLGYFLFAVLDKEERRKLVKFAFLSYSPKEEFVWCPGKIQRIWSRGIGGGNEASELKRSPLSQYSDDEGRDEET